MRKVTIYGDSIMKGTVQSETLRYHATINDYLEKLRPLGIDAQSRARFGMTIDKGYEALTRDMAAGERCDCALVEFGGNDCDYAWADISAHPEREHLPNTPLQRFKKLYVAMVDQLRAHGVRPILMTLPPIDAQRYLRFLCRNGNSYENILGWLKDVQLIYRTQESYSNAIARVAEAVHAPLVDVRAYFLDQRDLRAFIGPDGIHPTAQGYGLILRAFCDHIAAAL